jgi:hypothetical protein
MADPVDPVRTLKYAWAGLVTGAVAVTLGLEIVRPGHPANDDVLQVVSALWCHGAAHHVGTPHDHDRQTGAPVAPGPGPD